MNSARVQLVHFEVELRGFFILTVSRAQRVSIVEKGNHTPGTAKRLEKHRASNHPEKVRAFRHNVTDCHGCRMKPSWYGADGASDT